MTQRDAIELSVIVPIEGRHADLLQLHAEYRAAMEALDRSHEFIYVVDGVWPGVDEAVEQLLQSAPNIKAVNLTRSFGESTALMAGFEQATGSVIVTLPAYFQIDMSAIGKLVGSLDSADIVICHRWPRAGGLLERARRSAFHGLVNWMTGMKVHDLGCGVRAMKRSVLQEISLYGDQHRLLPALADRQGFRVLEIEVRQSPRDSFLGAYRPREYAHRLLDVFAVFFLVRFTKKPLRFFGMIGVTTLAIGSLLVLYLSVDRLVFSHALANRPALLLSSLLVVLGLQLFALGLLGELMIFTHARGLKDYQVDRVIEFSGDDRQPPQSRSQ